MISVVKVGGAAAGAAPKIADLRRAGRQVVVVHGAGPQISERCRAIGIEPRFLAGQRLTDAAVLAVVDQALAEVNARLVAELAGAGIAAQRTVRGARWRPAMTTAGWGWSAGCRASTRPPSASCWRRGRCR